MFAPRVASPAGGPTASDALAELAVHGANVQPGQVLAVGASSARRTLARAVAAAAYQRGAKFVDVSYFDPYVKRARIEHADPDTLAFVPQWFGDADARARRRARRARITFAGVDDAEPARRSRSRRCVGTRPAPAPEGDRRGSSATARRTGASSRARIRRGRSSSTRSSPPDEAYERLWAELEHVLRLDEPDPSRGLGRARWRVLKRAARAAHRAAVRRDPAARARAPS